MRQHQQLNVKRNTATTRNKQMTNELAIRNETGIETQNSNEQFMPLNREQFEMNRELQEAEAQIEALSMPKVTSQDLAKSGEVFTVTDAFPTTITQDGQEKLLVAFIIESPTLEPSIVLKDGNTINLKYTEFFGKFKAAGISRTMENMTFKERTDLPKRAGNHPIVLMRSPKVIKSANAK